MTKKKTSIIDQPVIVFSEEELLLKDKFGIIRYENALKEFVKRADTPLTIALQGEWGSGKTSLMNLLKYHLTEIKDAPFLSVWINTWQHSLMCTPEEAIVSILKNIVLQLGYFLGKEASRTKLNKAASFVGKFVKATTIGVANAAGKTIGLDNVGSNTETAFREATEDESVTDTGESKIAELKKAVSELIQQILKANPRKQGFLFFIDDLDRIDPPVAVQILELLKNIFDLENCIYILAIDYDVVVKGLKPKFGELNEKNAREFRSFFDKIIQLPFVMPISSYKIDSFLIDALNRIDYLTAEELADAEILENLSKFALYSVGTNPRSLKRLTNILSLIQLMTADTFPENNEGRSNVNNTIDKQINFALVCLQIMYPLVYNTLLEFPNFKEWGDPADLFDHNTPQSGKTLIKRLALQELTETEKRKLEQQGDDFDEPWEKTLFRLCLKDSDLTLRVVDISRLMSRIAALVPMTQNEGDDAAKRRLHNEEIGLTIERLIRFSAVTNVQTSGEAHLSQPQDFNQSQWLKTFSTKFTPAIAQKLQDFGKFYCTNTRIQKNLWFCFASNEPLRWGNEQQAFQITMGYDAKSYFLHFGNGLAYLWLARSADYKEEESALGHYGLRDSISAEFEELNQKYPEAKLVFETPYHITTKDGAFGGGAHTRVWFFFKSMEDMVSDASIHRIADFFNEFLRIRAKLAPCWRALSNGKEIALRESLGKMDIAPFQKIGQWHSVTILQGFRFAGQVIELLAWLVTGGFSLRLRCNGSLNALNELIDKAGLKDMFVPYKEGDFRYEVEMSNPPPGFEEAPATISSVLAKLKGLQA